MARGTGLIAAALLPLLAGCVDRRFVVTTNVPGAQVFVDNKPLGPSPVDSKWDFAGGYTFTALAPGYEPLEQRVKFKAKWYMYPPFDLIAESFYPGRIEDVRRVELTLQPSRQLTDQELIATAEQLRQEGKALPPTRFPEKKDEPRPAAAPGVAPAAPANPTPGPSDPVIPPLAPGVTLDVTPNTDRPTVEAGRR